VLLTVPRASNMPLLPVDGAEVEVPQASLRPG
jgi:hypothetical protein